MNVASLAAILLCGVIQGRVVDDQGQGLADCRVLIDTVGAVAGEPNYVDHYHYPDCGKATTTDADGNFRFDDVELNRRFTVVAYKNGYNGKRSPVFVAEDERPTLELANDTVSSPKRVLVGAAVDETGTPCANALIKLRESQQAGQRTYVRGAVGLLVAGSDGIFSLPLPESVDAVKLQIDSPGFVRTTTEPLTVDGEPALVIMKRGGAVMGRILLAGKPVPDLCLSVKVAVAGQGATPVYQRRATNADGRFVIECLPPDSPATMTTLPTRINQAVLPAGTFVVPANDKVADLGDIDATPGRRVQVRLVSADKTTEFDEPIELSIRNSIASVGCNKKLSEPGTANLGLHPVEAISLMVESKDYDVVKCEPPLQVVSSYTSSTQFRLGNRGDQEITLTVAKRGKAAN